MAPRPSIERSQWSGEYLLLLKNLILKDFKVRYRNMSLGIFWSILYPLVMMGVLAFVFTRIFLNPSTSNYAIFVLIGLVPYNFFTSGWINGTVSLVENTGLIKRLPIPREIIPIATVLSNSIHLIIQIVLLLFMAVVFGEQVNRFWVFLPVVWLFELIFACGLALLFSVINV